MKNNRTFLEKLLNGAEVEWKPLIKVASLTRGRVISKEYLTDHLGDYPVYSSQTVNNGEIGKINSFDFDGEFVSWTTDGANAGTVFYRSGKFSITNVCGLIKIQNNLELNYKFLFYWLSIEAKNHVYSGMGNPKLMSHQMEKILIPIPPLSVQTEIVKILDALTALTSELTSELILRRKQYEYYRETLLLPDNLEQLNTEGAKKKLSDVVNIYLGLTYTPTYVENGVKFISAQNTSNDFLDLSNTKFISREEFEKSTSNAKPKRGDILFTRVGSNLGHPVIVDTDEDLCIFVSLGFLRVKDKNILNSYIKHWMNTNLFWKQVEKNVHGSAKVNLNTGWLKDFEIYIPTLKEQQRIVSILDKFETLTNSINEGLPLAIEQSQKRYEYYRELLLNFS